jgi:hypothetical protein
MCLPTIRGSDVHDDFPFHFTSLGEFFFWVRALGGLREALDG